MTIDFYLGVLCGIGLSLIWGWASARARVETVRRKGQDGKARHVPGDEV